MHRFTLRRRLLRDGSPGADPSSGAPAGGGGTPPTDPPAADPPASGEPPKADQPKETDWKVESRKWEERAKDNKKSGDKASQQLTAVLKALGKNPDGTDAPPDPAAIQQQVEHAQAAAWSTTVENQVLRIKDVDADRLLDSRAFVDSLDPFVDDDPHSAEFKTKLAAHVRQYVIDNPSYKAASAGPARSGGEFPGGSGAGGAITEDQLASMTPDQISKAFNEGKLKHLM